MIMLFLTEAGVTAPSGRQFVTSLSSVSIAEMHSITELLMDL